jgi:hypothetical protein
VNGNLFFTKKPPFHRLITVVRKQCQTTVILTVPSVLKPCGFIFMEPGFVSCRLIRPVIPKSLLVINKPTNQRSILSNQASKCWSNSKPKPEGSNSLVTWLSWGDLSEAEPRGPVLFQTRLTFFSPKRDELHPFNPGEQPFISRLVLQI